ncbi:hypothetical protein [Isoptericola cucumis]|uniref:Integral membrane protein n=1 Tax=Isoptericola cucumis TaxID=1776856 RepID=A0ABQ2B617_9MICO|nr:hypothetical protein [Isoptericola cucumis]GGI06479.1 hypothetical protein GCM10007368_11370 [Isoptericola cucumis]
MSESAGGPPEQEPGPRQPPAYGQYSSGGEPQPPQGGYGPPPAGPPDPYRPGGDRPVSVGEAFSWAWSSFGRSAGPWLGAMLIVLMIGGAASVLLTPDLRMVIENYDDPNLATDLLQSTATVTDVLLAAVLAVVNIVLGALLAHGALAATHRGRAQFADFFAVRHLGAVLLLGVINGLLTFVLAFVPLLGSVLRLVIGFFLAAALFFVVDKGQDAVTAIRSSARLVSRHAGIVLLTIVLCLVTVFVGFLLCFVGAFVAVPVAMLTGAFVYRRLTGEQPVTPT